MADQIPISGLPAATSWNSTDLVPIVQSGVTKKATSSTLTGVGTLTSGVWTATPINLSLYASGTLQAAQFPALTGDITTVAGALATTLATVNSNTGSFGSSTAIPSFTVNAKGLITAASSNVVIAPAGTLTGTTLASNVVTSSLTAVAALASGSLAAGFTTVATTVGGTGQTAYTDGQLLIGNTATGSLSKATLTQGTGITITNGNGTITISQSGGAGDVTGIIGTASQVLANGTFGSSQDGEVTLTLPSAVLLNTVSAPSVNTILTASVTTARNANYVLSGNSMDGSSSTDGIALVLIHNATSNRQLGVVDSTQTASSSSNIMTRISPGAIDAIATDVSTQKQLSLGNASGGLALLGSVIQQGSSAGYQARFRDSSGNTGVDIASAGIFAQSDVFSTANLEIGSWVGSAHLTVMTILSTGQVTIGTSPGANRRLSVSPQSTDYYNIHSTGTLGGNTSSTSSAFYLDNTLSPTANTVNCYGLNIVPAFTPVSTNTIPVATALFARAAGSVGSGAVTLAFSGYFAHPTIGTTKVSLYAETNIVIGSVTPQGSGITVGHDVSSGGATTKNSYPVYFNGGYWNGSADTSINYSALTVVDSTSPTAHLSICNTNATEFIHTYLPTNDQGATFYLRSYGLNTLPPAMAIGGARGTVGSPTAVQNGDILGFYAFTGYGTNAWTGNTTGMWATATENWTNSAAGSKLSLGATATGGLLGVERIAITQNGTSMASTRFSFAKGADVASTANLAVGTDGNYFTITGTTTIETLSATNWQAGSIVYLQFTSALCTVKRLGSGTGAQIQLSAGVDYVSTQNAILVLIYQGTYWFQINLPIASY